MRALDERFPIGSRVERDAEDGDIETGTVIGHHKPYLRVRIDVDATAWRRSVIGPPSNITASWESWTVMRIDG